MCVSVGVMCTEVQVALKDSGTPWVGVIGSCKPPNKDAGNQIQVHIKSSLLRS